MGWHYNDASDPKHSRYRFGRVQGAAQYSPGTRIGRIPYPQGMNFDLSMLSGIVLEEDIGSGHTEIESLSLYINRDAIIRGPARRS